MIRDFLSDILPALNLATLVEGALIVIFLAGVVVAFGLAVTP